MTLLSTDRLSRTVGGVQALYEATSWAQEGAVTGLIGPNGAGKTTLFNAITGFAPANSGTVVFDGEEITNLKPWQIVRRGLSRSFQTPSGFGSMNVWENLMAAGSGGALDSPFAALWNARAHRAAQRRISERAGRLLDSLGLMDRLDRPLADLSVADLRIVEIARQLMSKPKMLMLDEPAAGFGPNEIGRLNRLIRRLTDDGMTTLIIEHNLSFILKLADYVFVLADGTVISHGSPAEIAKDEVVIRSYVGTSVGAS